MQYHSGGCKNFVVKKGVCIRHGANRANNDESTAFGSGLDMTTSTQSLPSFRATVRDGQKGDNVPGEVAVLCEEIVEI